MLYADKLTHRLKKDLRMYRSKEIESTFTELCHSNNSNKVTGCIYKHPKVPVTDFTEDYLVPPLEKLAKQKKKQF